MVGHGADEIAAAVALEAGMSLEGHVARRFTPEMGKAHDLTLVMESGRKHEITRHAPELSGRIVLFGHWTGARGIPNPFRKTRAFHDEVHARLSEAASGGAARLAPALGRKISK